jgi:hypothetical protein
VQTVTEVATSMVEVLSCVGVHLEAFGSMLGMSPFSTAFKAIGALCQAAAAAKHNNENCERIRRRASLLVPILVAVWRRQQQGGAALVDTIKSTIEGIKTVLDKQGAIVTSFMNSGWLKRGFNSSSFKSEAERLDRDLTGLLATLQLGLQEQFAVRLDEVFGGVKRIQDTLTYEINPKLDALLEESRRMADTVDETAAMVAEISLKLDEMARRSMCCAVVASAS